MNRPPLFTTLPPANPMNLSNSQHLNGKSQPNPQVINSQLNSSNPSTHGSKCGLLPSPHLPNVQAPPNPNSLIPNPTGANQINQLNILPPLTNPLANFNTRPPNALLPPNNLTAPGLPPANRLPLVVNNQSPSNPALLNRLPNPQQQLLQNPTQNLLPRAAISAHLLQTPPPTHLLSNPPPNVQAKPPHLLQTPSPLITNPAIVQANGSLNEQINNQASQINKLPSNDNLDNSNVNNKQSDVQASTNNQNEITWVETKTNDGKYYYFNSKTRETSWKKPDNCKIITHEQFVQSQKNDKPKEPINSFHHLPFQPIPGGELVFNFEK